VVVLIQGSIYIYIKGTENSATRLMYFSILIEQNNINKKKRYKARGKVEQKW